MNENKIGKSMTEYDELDLLYDVLYASHDDEFYEKDFLNQMKGIIQKGIKIHDASCGNGIKTVALAKEGYCISASDISKKMVAITNTRAKNANVKIDTFVSTWADLPLRNEKHDVVLCCGNSISHSISKEDRIKNLLALKKCIRKNGLLVLDSRNWEKIETEKYTVFLERTYKGKKYVPIYIWDINSGEKKSFVDILFIESDGTNLRTYMKQLSFSIFSHEEIVEELKNIGLGVEKDTYTENSNEYTLVLRNRV
jgi:glycine/sarcosine N-methyltransferase